MANNDEEKTGFESIGDRLSKELDEDQLESNQEKREFPFQNIKQEDSQPEKKQERTNNVIETTGQIKYKSDTSSHFFRNFILIISGLVVFIFLVYQGSSNNTKSNISPTKQLPDSFSKSAPSTYSPSQEVKRSYKEEVAERIRKGNEFLKQKKLEEAIHELKKAIELDYNNGEAFVLLGFCYLGQKKFELARDNFNRASELIADDGYIYFFRGVANHSLGNFQNAIDDYRRAKELNNRIADKTFYFNLADAYASLKRYSEAKDNLINSARLGHQEAKNILKSMNIEWEKRSRSPKQDRYSATKNATSEKTTKTEKKYILREWIDEQGNKHWTYGPEEAAP